MTKAERLAHKLCRAAQDEIEARGKSHLYSFMLTTIAKLAKATEGDGIEATLQVAEDRRWAQATPRGTFMLLEAGRQMLKGKA